MPQIKVSKKVFEQLEEHANFPFEEDTVMWLAGDAYIEVPQDTLDRLLSINPDTEFALRKLLNIKVH